MARCLQYSVSTGSETVTLDFVNETLCGQITSLWTVIIDNTNNSDPLYVHCSITDFKFSCTAGSRGVFPLLLPITARLSFDSAGAANVQIFLYELSMPLIVWQAPPPIGLSDYLAEEIGITYALLTESGQQIIREA